MTKTLTEKWREGTLPEGYYYTKLNDDDGTIVINYCWDDGCFQDYCDNMIDEVLTAVPRYDEYKRLVSNSDELEKMAFHYTPEEWNTMMRMVERLQEQLKEANDLIMWVVRTIPTGNKDEDDFDRYCNKWGVK